MELRDILDPEAIELILNACEGLTRTALQVARAAWIQASKEKSSSIGHKHIEAVQKTIPAASNGGRPPLATEGHVAEGWLNLRIEDLNRSAKGESLKLAPEVPGFLLMPQRGRQLAFKGNPSLRFTMGCFP